MLLLLHVSGYKSTLSCTLCSFFPLFFSPTPLLILTWRSQLILAGGAGQRQALAESVHPVEADGDVGLRHGLQGFCGCEGELGGLVGEAGLRGLGVAWTAALRGGGTKERQAHHTTVIDSKVKLEAERMDWSGGPVK